MSAEVFHSSAAKGIVVLMHGLNTAPNRFRLLKTIFVEHGFHVMLVAFKGHEASYADFTNVTADDWRLDVENVYKQARQIFPNLPVYACGYSLGGLVQVVCSINAPYRPDKMVLLAPALCPRWYTHLVRSLGFLPGRWSLPSYSPKGYAAHPKVPLAAYGSLFALWKQLHQNKTIKDVPALVWMDPKDELVSLRSTRSFIKKHKLKNWELHTLPVSKKEKKNRYHHLIFDDQSMGADRWKAMTSKILAFLNGDMN